MKKPNKYKKGNINSNKTVNNFFRNSALLTCPLLFYSLYMCFTKVPMLSENLPLPITQMLCGEGP